jgi:hypothetical protein
MVGFFAAIAKTIERAGGAVHRKYETLLLLARRRWIRASGPFGSATGGTHE